MAESARPRDEALRSPARRRVADALTVATPGGLDAHELADRVGLHVTTVRWHLERLEAANLVHSHPERAGSAGRPRKIYRLVDVSPDATVDDDRDRRSLHLLSALLIDMLATQHARRTVSPEEAGEQWALEHMDPDASRRPATTPGEWLSKLGGLTDVLHEWGYTPAISTGADRDNADVRLTHCPFRDLARANPAVVCGIHRGLMRGAMSKLGERTTDVELLPFLEGDTCVAHLRRRPPLELSQTPEIEAKESSDDRHAD